jgi:hypothetical protein
VSWTEDELLAAVELYQRELELSAGARYSALAAGEARQFIAWLAGGQTARRDGAIARGGNSSAGVPPRIAEVVKDWIDRGKPAQPPSTWIRPAWLAMLPEHETILADLPDELDRPFLRQVAASAGATPEAALRAFLAVMVWGYGTGPLGPFRTWRILDQAPDAAERLMGAARAVARSAEDGYRHLAKAGRMRFLGPAYGTKFLLVAQPPGAATTALILDSYVAEGLGELASVHLDPVPWRWSTYERYLKLMHGWAADLGVAAEDLEYVVFQWVADRHGGQWAGEG